jgi:hypothetical protein
MVGDQHQYQHDHHRAEDDTHDDHRGVGQANQVQPLCSRFGALFLFALGLATATAITTIHAFPAARMVGRSVQANVGAVLAAPMRRFGAGGHAAFGMAG